MGENGVVELNDKNWADRIEMSGEPVVVMFYDPRCPHCRKMMPYFDMCAEMFKSRILFGRIDVTENTYTLHRYGIMAVPTIKFFCSGRPVQEIVGEVDPALLQKTAQDSLEHGQECVARSSPVGFGRWVRLRASLQF